VENCRYNSLVIASCLDKPQCRLRGEPMKLRSAPDDLFATKVFDTPSIDTRGTLPQVAPAHCPQCGTGMLLLEKAARLCQCNRRVLYRWVEERRLHFCELADGSVAICGQTLAAQMNEQEIVAAQLPGPAAARAATC